MTRLRREPASVTRSYRSLTEEVHEVVEVHTEESSEQEVVHRHKTQELLDDLNPTLAPMYPYLPKNKKLKYISEVLFLARDEASKSSGRAFVTDLMLCMLDMRFRIDTFGSGAEACWGLAFKAWDFLEAPAFLPLRSSSFAQRSIWISFRVRIFLKKRMVNFGFVY